MKSSPLHPGAKSLKRGSTFAATPKPLKRSPLHSSTQRPRKPISPASPAQREAVADRACIVCAKHPCHPAHVIDRSLGGTDNPRDVVALCPTCHRLYDDGKLSILEYMEPYHRDELARAVELVGLLRALERVTNCRWAPERSAT